MDILDALLIKPPAESFDPIENVHFFGHLLVDNFWDLNHSKCLLALTI
jgi:hypothetical protein